MPITIEELNNELDSNEQLRNEAIKTIASKFREPVFNTLKEGGFEVLDEQGKTSLLERYKEDIMSKHLPEKVKSIHDQYDQTLKKFGIERKQDEKTYNALERGLTERQQQIETLKAQSGGDEELKRKIEEIENNAKTSIAEKDKQLQELQNKYATTEKRIELEKLFSPIKAKFKSDLPSYFKSHEDRVLNEVLQNAVVEGDEMFMGDGNGNILKDSSYSPIKVQDYLNDQFKDVFKDDKKPSGGAGANDDPNNGSDSEALTAENFQMPGTVKTKGDLDVYMIEKGLQRGTKQFTDIWGKFSKELPL